MPGTASPPLAGQRSGPWAGTPASAPEGAHLLLALMGDRSAPEGGHEGPARASKQYLWRAEPARFTVRLCSCGEKNWTWQIEDFTFPSDRLFRLVCLHCSGVAWLLLLSVSFLSAFSDDPVCVTVEVTDETRKKEGRLGIAGILRIVFRHLHYFPSLCPCWLWSAPSSICWEIQIIVEVGGLTCGTGAASRKGPAWHKHWKHSDGIPVGVGTWKVSLSFSRHLLQVPTRWLRFPAIHTSRRNLSHWEGQSVVSCGGVHWSWAWENSSTCI